jgi:hypothetical protein
MKRKEEWKNRGEENILKLRSGRKEGRYDDRMNK